ncbi:MAG TPA: serine hydrolase domain-containing protein [Acidimicrobiia bacterium]
MSLRLQRSRRCFQVGSSVAAVVLAVVGVAGVAALPATADISARLVQTRVDEATLAGVEEYLETQRSDLGLPGMAAGVVRGDEVVLLRGFGETEVGGEPVRPGTPFLVASLSKSMTALALIQLVEEGRVDLNAPVSTYLSELGPGGDEVSVRDLMHHRSGLTTYTGVEPFAGELGSSLQANVERLGPLFESSAPYTYSNANYDTMALIVESVSGIGFADYMDQHVFEPLDMTHSFVDSSQASEAGLAQGHYHWLFLGYREHTPPMPPGLAASHTMFSSAEDLTHFLIAHLNGGAYRGHRVVSEESLQMLHEPRAYDSDPNIGYAGGWQVGPSFAPGLPDGLSDLITLWHSGGSSAYRGVMWMIPEANLGFVVLANGNDIADESLLPQVAQGVKSLLFDLEPREITALSPLLLRWGKHLLLAVVVGQVVFAITAGMSMNRYLAGHRPEIRDWGILAAATLLDLLALLGIVWIIPSVGRAPLRVVLDQPDYRILIIGMAAGVGWGLIRTTLVVTGLFRRRRWLASANNKTKAPTT